MSYNPTIASNERPSNTRTKFNNNFDRLETILGANHQFNAAADSTDGHHVLVDWEETDSSSISTGAGLQTFANEPTANVGTLLFNRLTSSNADLSGFMSPMTVIGNVTATTWATGAPAGNVILDPTGLTYLDCLITISGNISGSLAGAFSRFVYDGTNAIRSNTSTGVLSGLNISFASSKITVANSSGVSATNCFWSMQIMRIAPLS